ncbi:ComEC/Rec2 family competence protein [Sulfitobacter sp. 1151]|uniref:ComEC/Rec2 family competence protein n=2 Tax=Parasulfitobacter algicola TaxID=2614809 RepID=A0ABX2IZC3_9RHOB|nr:ComEC/Rec2 family competence protein [Sulfitobacter algicola]NSX55688.1 ComEC/Rec2 family competence protein [Sulfitobacter algicola]
MGMLAAQRGHLFPWVPVFMGIGIAWYFMLPAEPTRFHIGLSGAFVIAPLVLRLVRLVRISFVMIPFALIAFGLLLGALRANMVAEPVLGWRYYGAVEGRIIAIDRSQSDVPRLTLDQVILDNVSPERTPTRVRVSLHGEQKYLTPKPGMTVILTAHLSPPQGAVEPGGFDFQRMAWFRRLGAVGYTRTPALVLEPARDRSFSLMIARLRQSISQGVQARMPGDAGAFAAAILTGDRSGIGQDALEDLRASNLAHLLAISGLHMGLLTAFVFGAVRFGIALIPAIALRVQAKKVAAVVALAAAAFYLMLSGGSVATERAFIMVAVMLIAILCNRRALTLRAVALAAVIVLVLRPEALMGPGFQMSFAATTALVAVFGAIRGRDRALPKFLRPIFGLIMSSAVAGAATAPFAAAHFNQIAHYGLLANVLTVPLMGAVIIPCAVIGGLLWPLGLDWIAFYIMGLGIEWIIFVADWIAGLDGSLSHVPAPGLVVLPLVTLGGLFVILWRDRTRWVGVVPILGTMVLWAQVERPVVLISESGGLVGVMTPQGRALSKPRGEGFIALSWLENDGDTALQEDAAARRTPGMIRVGGQSLLHATGKSARQQASDCDGAAWLIVNVDIEEMPDCTVLTPDILRQTGAVAISHDLKITTAREAAGLRLWNQQQFDQDMPELMLTRKPD